MEEQDDAIDDMDHDDIIGIPDSVESSNMLSSDRYHSQDVHVITIDDDNEECIEPLLKTPFVRNMTQFSGLVLRTNVPAYDNLDTVGHNPVCAKYTGCEKGTYGKNKQGQDSQAAKTHIEEYLNNAKAKAEHLKIIFDTKYFVNPNNENKLELKSKCIQGDPNEIHFTSKNIDSKFKNFKLMKKEYIKTYSRFRFALADVEEHYGFAHRKFWTYIYKYRCCEHDNKAAVALLHTSYVGCGNCGTYILILCLVLRIVFIIIVSCHYLRIVFLLLLVYCYYVCGRLN